MMRRIFLVSSSMKGLGAPHVADLQSISPCSRMTSSLPEKMMRTPSWTASTNSKAHQRREYRSHLAVWTAIIPWRVGIRRTFAKGPSLTSSPNWSGTLGPTPSPGWYRAKAQIQTTCLSDSPALVMPSTSSSKHSSHAWLIRYCGSKGSCWFWSSAHPKPVPFVRGTITLPTMHRIVCSWCAGNCILTSSLSSFTWATETPQCVGPNGTPCTF
mmetsp:Transcript_97893/g.226985  ORF Transcript_97893/g.226985 Transcript_97893/m.226985 type:complete len:213 (-) Transcript_97893:59-697(-)